jgi:predicted enzyme related to lactoylglutathione lyase
VLHDSPVFSGFSTNDIEKAKIFYGQTLGLDVSENVGVIGAVLSVKFSGGGEAVIYAKDNHVPASFTVLNFRVDDIEAAVDKLVDAGIMIERYEGLSQDERGIARENPPPIAWFTDPAGNILSVVEAHQG